jgi:hypothetical protein
MCRIDYADECDGLWFLEPGPRRARKAHHCQDCGRTIEPGETYTYGKGLSEGDFFVAKMCEQCVAAGRWLVKVCGGHFWPGVVEELVEHWEEEPDYRSLGLGRLIVGARRHWRIHGRLATVEEIDRWVTHGLTHCPALSTSAYDWPDSEAPA